MNKDYINNDGYDRCLFVMKVWFFFEFLCGWVCEFVCFNYLWLGKFLGGMGCCNVGYVFEVGILGEVN